MTLGTQTDAARALSFRHAINQYWIGAGAFRSAYLISGVVYKMTSECENWVNDAELEAYAHTRQYVTLPEWLKIPMMTGFIVDDQLIVAAEFVPGISMGLCDACSDAYSDYCGEVDCLGPRAETIKDLGFMDAHCEGNCIQHADGSLYIVDLPG